MGRTIRGVVRMKNRECQDAGCGCVDQWGAYDLGDNRIPIMECANCGYRESAVVGLAYLDENHDEIDLNALMFYLP